MNFDYVLRRNPDLEERARTKPYLFGPSSFRKVNLFLAGTGISFENEPISRYRAGLCLSLLDAYASELAVGIAPGVFLKYLGCRNARYVWANRSHSFYFIDCKSNIKVFKQMRLGNQIHAGSEQWSKDDWQEQHPRWIGLEHTHLALAQKKLQAVLRETFGIGGETRVSVSFVFDFVEATIESVY